MTLRSTTQGLDFDEVVIVDFFRCLEKRNQSSWKRLLWWESSGRDAPQAPLYRGYPLAEASELCWDRVNQGSFCFHRQLEEKGKSVKLVTDCQLKLPTGMMSPDEWIHHGLEFTWKVWECRSEVRDGGSVVGEIQDIVDELWCLDDLGKLFYMCPESWYYVTIYMCSYYYICVLILLYMCPHTDWKAYKRSKIGNLIQLNLICII